MRSSAALLVAWLGLGGCADLPPMESHVCGNGVLDTELGELCDTFVDSSLGPALKCGAPGRLEGACRYVCGRNSECPVGWGCAQNGVCHYATGQFQEAVGSPWRLAADKMVLGDVDGDQFEDIVGFSSSAQTVRFGAREGQFPASFTLNADFPQGVPVSGDLDGNSRLDVVVPVSAGLFVTSGQKDRTLEPIVYTPFELRDKPQGGLLFLPLDADASAPGDEVVVMAGLGDFVAMQFVATAQSEEDGPLEVLAEPLDVQPGDDPQRKALAGRVPVANIDDPTDGTRASEEMALAFRGHDRVYVYEGLRDAGILVLRRRQVVSLPAEAQVLDGARFADVDGDGLLDLMISIGKVSEDRVVVAPGTSTGQFGPAAVDPVFDQILGYRDDGTTTCWPLAAADLNFDGVADYVTGEAAFLRGQEGVWAGTYRSTLNAWTDATIADFNRDGVNDFVVGSSAVRGLDFYLGDGSGLFNRRRIATETPPVLMREGDFDGDRVADLAVVEADWDSDSLSVVYGNLQDGLHERVPMGRILHIDFLEPLHAIFDVTVVDVTHDLLVLAHGDGGRDDRSIAIMIGSVLRRMLSPFSLQLENNRMDSPIAVQVGHFDPSQDPALDLIAIAPPRVWLVRGSEGARYMPKDAFATRIDDLRGTFDPTCALWAAGNLDGPDGILRDQLVGIDNTDLCLVPGAPAPAPRLLIGRLGEEEGKLIVRVEIRELTISQRIPHEIKLRDLDGDTKLDLIVTYAGSDPALSIPEFPSPPTDSGVVVYWNVGGEAVFRDDSVTVAPAMSANALYAAELINADAHPDQELAVLTDLGIYVLKSDGARQFLAAEGRRVDQYSAGSLLVLDVNQDGLDDLVSGDYTGLAVHVHVAMPDGSEPLPLPLEDDR